MHPFAFVDTRTTQAERLQTYLQPELTVRWDANGIALAPLPVYSQSMLANAYFFGHPRWAKKYLAEAHRGRGFRDRWQHALHRLDLAQGWDQKIVVDLGCGPGNLFATLGGQPAALMGVDISYGALRHAQQQGYLPILADAHHLPLADGCADVVVANALLHHCDDMARVLAEAGRLVKSGGILITDLDPQRSAWTLEGWGLWLQQWQLPDWLFEDENPDERIWQLATERHNRQPGVGLEPDLYRKVLEPLGFSVHLYPHNPDVGSEIFLGDLGRSPFKTRLSQRLSGLDPDTSAAALSLMCVAHRDLSS